MITTYLSVALILAVILMIRRPFARAYGAKAAYALWALPLIRLVLPPLPAWMTPASLFPASSTVAEPAVSSAVAVTIPSAPSLKAPGGAIVQPPAPIESVSSAAPLASPEPAAAASSLFTLPSWETLLTSLIVVTLTGAAILIARQLHAQWQFAWLIRNDSETPSKAVMARAEAVRKQVGLRRRVPVRASFLCGAPLVTGVLRPVILVPAWFELDYSDEEQRIALTHEMMHVKRGDLLALQLAHAVCALQWLNPFSWQALDAFRADQEAACDADVLRLNTASPRAYGATLLKAIRQSRPTPPPAFVAALPLNHAIKDRFALLDRQDETPRRRTGLALTLIGGTALMVATAGTVSADEELQGGQADQDNYSYSWSSSDMQDRQLVILGDPMAEFNAKMAKMDEIRWPEPPSPPQPPIPPRFDEELQEMLAELEELTAVHHLAILGHDSGIAIAGLDPSNLSGGQGETVFILRNGEVDTDELEDRIDEMVDRIEEHADKIEARADAWAASFELDAERFERHAERIATMAESYVNSPDVQRALDAGVDAIESLNDGCMDTVFTRGQVIEVLEADNGTVAICVDGQAKKSDVDAAVRAHSGLSSEERAAFFANRDDHVHVHVARNGQDKVHIRIDGADGHSQSWSYSHSDDEECEDETHAHIDDEECEDLE